MANAILTDILDGLGEEMCAEIKNELMKRNKIASGKLYNSITYKIKESSGVYSLEIIADAYLKNVDRGRGKGKDQPPIDPIILWLKQKRIPIKQARTINTKTGTKAARGRGAASDKQLRGVAFYVAKKISKKGVAPFGTKFKGG